MVPGRLARGHSRRCRLPRFPLSPSTFLRPFAPDPLQTLLSSYGRSDSCPPRSWTLSLNACSTYGQGSLIHAPGLPTILSPTTCGRSVSPRYATFRRIESRSLPYGSSPYGTRGFGIHSPPRPTSPAESSFYRTDWPFTSGCSPPRLATTQLPSVTPNPRVRMAAATLTRFSVRHEAGALWVAGIICTQERPATRTGDLIGEEGPRALLGNGQGRDLEAVRGGLTQVDRGMRLGRTLGV